MASREKFEPPAWPFQGVLAKTALDEAGKLLEDQQRTHNDLYFNNLSGIGQAVETYKLDPPTLEILQSWYKRLQMPIS